MQAETIVLEKPWHEKYASIAGMNPAEILYREFFRQLTDPQDLATLEVRERPAFLHFKGGWEIYLRDRIDTMEKVRFKGLMENGTLDVWVRGSIEGRLRSKLFDKTKEIHYSPLLLQKDIYEHLCAIIAQGFEEDERNQVAEGLVAEVRKAFPDYLVVPEGKTEPPPTTTGQFRMQIRYLTARIIDKLIGLREALKQQVTRRKPPKSEETAHACRK